MLSEKPKPLKFPEFDDFHSTRDYVLAIKAFRKSLVKELQKNKGDPDLSGWTKGWNAASDWVLAKLGVEKKEKQKQLDVEHNFTHFCPCCCCEMNETTNEDGDYELVCSCCGYKEKY